MTGVVSTLIKRGGGGVKKKFHTQNSSQPSNNKQGREEVGGTGSDKRPRDPAEDCQRTRETLDYLLTVQPRERGREREKETS